MRTRLEVFQRLDSRFRGNDKQGGNDEGDALPLVPLSETRVTYVCKPPSIADLRNPCGASQFSFQLQEDAVLRILRGAGFVRSLEIQI